MKSSYLILGGSYYPDSKVRQVLTRKYYMPVSSVNTDTDTFNKTSKLDSTAYLKYYIP